MTDPGELAVRAVVATSLRDLEDRVAALEAAELKEQIAALQQEPRAGTPSAP